MNDQTKSKLKPKTGAEKDLNLKSIWPPTIFQKD